MGARASRSQRRLLDIRSGPDTEGDHLNRALRIGVAVNTLMLRVERRGGLIWVPRHGQLIALAGIADIGRTDELSSRRFPARDALQAPELPFEIGAVQNARRVVAHLAGQQHAQCGESAGVLGDENYFDSELPRDLAGVQTATAAEGH